MGIKALFKRISDEFIYGGHLLSLGASGIVLSFLLVFEQRIEWQILIIPYLLSQLIYGFNHMKEAKSDLNSNPERADFILSIKIRAIGFFAFYLSLLLFFVATYLNSPSKIFILGFLAFGILYTLVIKKLTKKIFALKDFYVAFFWSLLALLPIFQYKLTLSTSLFLFFVFVFIRWLVNTIYFDIKDTEEDGRIGLKNFSTVFGLKKTLLVLHFFNFLSMVILIIGILKGYLPFYFVAMGGLFLYSYYYLKVAEKESIVNIRRTSYTLVDGEYLLWPFVLFAAKSWIG